MHKKAAIGKKIARIEQHRICTREHGSIREMAWAVSEIVLEDGTRLILSPRETDSDIICTVFVVKPKRSKR